MFYWDIKNYVNSTTEFWEILPCDWVKVLIFRIVQWEFAILWTSQCFSPLNFQPNLCSYLLSGIPVVMILCDDLKALIASHTVDCVELNRGLHTHTSSGRTHSLEHPHLVVSEGLGISDYMESPKESGSKSRICLLFKSLYMQNLCTCTTPFLRCLNSPRLLKTKMSLL